MAKKSSSVTPVDDRILEAAVDHFGRLGLAGASTRAIAASAGTMMSSITYHYGGKQELYLAAARHIAKHMEERMSSVLASPDTRGEAAQAPGEPLTSILTIVDRFTEILLRPESAAWARFAVREQMEPTEAFEVLHGGVLGRIVDRLATLMGDRCEDGEARLKALAIIGQAMVFRVARGALLRVTGWDDVDDTGAAAIRKIVRAHTTAIFAETDARRDTPPAAGASRRPRDVTRRSSRRGERGGGSNSV